MSFNPAAILYDTTGTSIAVQTTATTGSENALVVRVAGNIATTTIDNQSVTVAVPTVASIFGWSSDLTGWSRIRAEGTNADGEAVIDPTVQGARVLSTESYLKMFNGTTWDRVRGSISGGLVVSNPTLYVTGTLGALNASIVLQLQGSRGASFLVQSGTTLTGNLMFESSMDNGANYNWSPAVYAGGYSNANYQLASQPCGVTSGVTSLLFISVLPGTTHIRVRVSTYTSGTCSASLAGTQAQAPTQVMGNSSVNTVLAAAAQYPVPIGSYDSGGTLRNIAIDSTGRLNTYWSNPTTGNSPDVFLRNASIPNYGMFTLSAYSGWAAPPTTSNSYAQPLYMNNWGGIFVQAVNSSGTAQNLSTVTRNSRAADSGLVVRNIPPTGSRAAFGANLVSQETVRVNLTFPYNIVNTRAASTAVTGSGTITYSNGKVQLNTTATVSSSASLQSRENIRYVPGQGVIARFTAIFTTGVANSQQEIGIGNATDGFFFGYQGASFGIFRRAAGVDTFVARASWNGDDKFDGTGPSSATHDPTKGSPYMIQYQWLGFGAIKYYIEDPTTGEFVLVHTILYANANTDTSIRNATLPLWAKVSNTTNNTAITLATASMSAITEGVGDWQGNEVRNTFSAVATGVPTTGARVFGIQNKATNVLGGTNTNRVPIHLDNINIRSATANDMYVTLYLNPTTTTPTWTDLNTNTSVMQTDVAGTVTGAGGTALMTFSLAGGNTLFQQIADFNIRIYPGEYLYAVAFAESGTIGCRVSLGWHEEF
jgi:hypothetical protein